MMTRRLAVLVSLAAAFSALHPATAQKKQLPKPRVRTGITVPREGLRKTLPGGLNWTRRTGPLTFADRIDLSGRSIGTASPQLAASGTNVYATYPMNGEIYLSRSIDSGETFEPPARMSTTAARSWAHQVAASGDNVYVAWVDEFTVRGDIFFRRSDDGGESFDDTVNLSDSPGRSSRAVSLAASGDNVYVAWCEDLAVETDPAPVAKVVIRASNDGGATFGDLVNLNAPLATQVVDNVTVVSAQFGSGKPTVVADGDAVHVVWEQAMPTYELRDGAIERVDFRLGVAYRRSANGGLGFADPMMLSVSASTWGRPQVAVSGQNVYVTWMDTLGVRRGNEDILFRASTNGGARFADAINLSNTPARSWRGDIEASGNGVHVAWIDEVGGDKDILLRTSGDQGARFSPAVNLSDNGRDSTNPSVSAAGRYIYVAWQQRTSGHYTIRLRWSNDTGGAFGEGVEISNFGTRGSSHAPTVIGIGNHVYAAWQDHGLGAMYRKGARSETRAIPGLILRDGIKDR